MRHIFCWAGSFFISLNPYSTGRYSMRYRETAAIRYIPSLNPYSTGRYSMRLTPNFQYAIVNGVLILILLEDTL